MRIGLWLFGAEVFCLQIGPLPADEAQPSGDYKGDCTTTPIGFAVNAGDQRWEKSPELE